MAKQHDGRGKVYLIGAGPGDPGLLTVKAREILQDCDVVVYDYLANPAFLEYIQEGCKTIYVGKKSSQHTLSQEEINQLLVDLGKHGKVVARLKGGDPYIFGRGGEEAQALRENGIPFEVVSGITSAIAAPAYAGIPLSHRGFTSTIGIVTGHERPDKDKSAIDWKGLASAMGTLVFLMGVKNLKDICKNLIRAGRDPSTPAAMIRWGTTPRQQTVTGTIKTMPGIAESEGVKPPAILVVGWVVTLRDSLNWFEIRPLFGKRIVVTRARAQASEMSQRLEALGAEVSLASFSEWLYYTNFTRARTARRRKRWRELLVNMITDHTQHKIEKRLAEPLERYFGPLAERPIEHVLELASPYIHDSFEGEAILSVGKAVEFAREGADGVINVGPFTCMPSTIVSGIMRQVSRDLGGLPIVNVTFDGQLNPMFTTQLEAFVHQASAFKNRRSRQPLPQTAQV